MKLLLQIGGEGTARGAEAAPRSFDERGGSVGRGEENSWVLPDPDRKLSRKHFIVDCDGSAFWLTDTSSNGVFLNYAGERLEQGRRVKLNNGDHLRLGDYEIDVWVEKAPPDNVEQDNGDTFARVLLGGKGQPVAGDAIDDLLGRREPMAQPSGNPFMPPPQPVTSQSYAPPPTTLPFAPALGDPFGGEDDSLFAPPRQTAIPAPAGSFPDHLPAENAFFRPPAALPDDWYVDFPAPPTASPPPQGGLPDDWDLDIGLTEDASVAAEPPPPKADSPFIPEPAAALPIAAPPPVNSNADALLAAFLAGAGLPAQCLAGMDQEQVFRTIGALYRASVGGLRELLQARAALKNELRVEQTMVRTGGNNPLKFYATTDELLAVLLGAPRPGYLPAAVAVAEAVGDIKAHEMGVAAGMQEAVQALLGLLDPIAFEKRFGDGGGLGGFIPSSRKAKCWEAFTKHHAHVVDQCGGDASVLVDRNFVAAYRRQVGKMGSGGQE